MKIFRRLPVLLAAAITPLVVVALVNVFSMQRVHDLTDYANRNTVPSLQILDDVLVQFMKLRIRLYRRITIADSGIAPEIEESIVEARDGLYRALSKYEAYVGNDEDRRHLEEERRLIDASVASLAAAFELASKDRYAAATRVMRETIPLALSAQDAIGRHIDFNSRQGRKASQDAVALVERATLLSLGVSCFSIAVIMLLTFFARTNPKARHVAAIVNTSDDAIISKTLDGTITSWNPGAERIFGYEEQEALGKSILMLIPPDRMHEEPEILARIRQGERVDHFETVRLRKDGTPIHISVTVSPILSAAGTIVGASKIARDITKAKLAEEALKEAKREAELANQAKSEFLANMSHEIRTPMNAIIGMTQLVLEGDLAPSQEKYLRKVSASSKALLQILNDILDYSKIEAGRMDVEAIPFCLSDVLQQSLDLFGTQIEEKSLFVTCDVDPDVPAWVRGDPLRLSQVLHNLLGNAIKFTERGGIGVRIAKEAEEGDVTILRISVKDTGIGLKPEQAGQLFNPFVQADSSVNRKYGGTGLGLAICQSLVTLMGGEIAVSSQPGDGATFTFTVRLGRVGAPPEAQPEKTPAPAGKAAPPALPRFDGIIVLLAEDRETNQDVATAFVEMLGGTVMVAGNGAEACDLAERIRFDIVLMDLHMPVMDGLAAARRIRETLGAKAPPIVAMSAAVFEEDRRHCREAGMVDFIAKPIRLEEIAACFGHVLEGGSRNAALTPAPAADASCFDLDHLAQRLQGNRVLAGRLVRQCVQGYARFSADFETMLAEGRLDDAAAALHGLRGSISNIGVLSLSGPCLALERQLRQGERPAPSAVRDLAQALAAVLRDLAAAAEPAVAPVDITSVAGDLRRLIPYLEQGEVIPDTLMDTLSAYQRARPADMAIGQLMDRLDAFDHQGALLALERMGIHTSERL